MDKIVNLRDRMFKKDTDQIAQKLMEVGSSPELAEILRRALKSIMLNQQSTELGFDVFFEVLEKSSAQCVRIVRTRDGVEKLDVLLIASPMTVQHTLLSECHTPSALTKEFIVSQRQWLGEQVQVEVNGFLSTLAFAIILLSAIGNYVPEVYVVDNTNGPSLPSRTYHFLIHDSSIDHASIGAIADSAQFVSLMINYEAIEFNRSGMDYSPQPD